jgi:HlyD family secretion protein
MNGWSGSCSSGHGNVAGPLPRVGGAAEPRGVPIMHLHSPADGTNATISSIDAYVLPQVVEVTSGSEGCVARLLVNERDQIRRGQDLLEITCERARCDRDPCSVSLASSSTRRGAASTSDARQRITLRASLSGIVSRCHVNAGDAVVRGKPVLSVLRADDLLVIAHFEATARPRLRSARTAWVHIPRAGVHSIPARIIRIGGIYPRPASEAAERDDGAVRVVAQLDFTTLDALWPGIEVIVEVGCCLESAA